MVVVGQLFDVPAQATTGKTRYKTNIIQPNLGNASDRGGLFFLKVFFFWSFEKPSRPRRNGHRNVYGSVFDHLLFDYNGVIIHEMVYSWTENLTFDDKLMEKKNKILNIRHHVPETDWIVQLKWRKKTMQWFSFFLLWDNAQRHSIVL